MYHYSVITNILSNEPLTYISEALLERGDFVMIEIRKKISIGIIDRLLDIDSQQFDFQIKTIKEKLLIPRLTCQNIKILKDVAHHQMEFIGTIFSTILNHVENFWKSLLDLEKIAKILNKSNIISNNKLQVKDLEQFLYSNKCITQFLYQQNIHFQSIVLTDNQLEALEMLNQKTNKNIMLLEGETGSGKTIVYLEKIKQLLIEDPNAQILILLPEIALTNSILLRVESYLGVKPFSWHSNLTPKERKENFLASIFSIGRIIVGARSAIFLPFHNLKLIIIDEEHDNSFKQEQQILYKTIDIAKIINQYNQSLQIILSSATPSLETIYFIKNKDYSRIPLKSEKTLKDRMEIKVENMNSGSNKNSIISDKIIESINRCLERNLQSMIFLNRRGYHSIIVCKECNNKLNCKNCSVTMIFHKELKKFFCPYCNFSMNSNKAHCTNCFSENDFKFYGYGIEKIYELIKENFPELAAQNKIALLSSDNTVNLQQTISMIEEKEVDVVVGTQLLAKGHNFPHLAFLGIIDGGLNFSGVDLNSSEKTYQILHQIVGRLGRFQTKGEIIIQTTSQNSLILNALVEQNRTKFYSYELQQRKIFNMPPFSQLFKVTFSHSSLEIAEKNALKFINALDHLSEVEIAGPSPSSVIKFHSLYRYNIMIKASNKFDLQVFLYDQFSKYNINTTKFRIDISPSNFV